MQHILLTFSVRVLIDLKLTERILFQWDFNWDSILFSLDQSKIVTSNNSDQALYGSSNLSFNTGFGLYYYNPKLFVGFSIPEFFTNIYDTNTSEYKSSLNMRNVHYYLYGGYVFEINDQLALKTFYLESYCLWCTNSNGFNMQRPTLPKSVVWLNIQIVDRNGISGRISNQR